MNSHFWSRLTKVRPNKSLMCFPLIWRVWGLSTLRLYKSCLGWKNWIWHSEKEAEKYAFKNQSWDSPPLDHINLVWAELSEKEMWCLEKWGDDFFSKSHNPFTIISFLSWVLFYFLPRLFWLKSWHNFVPEYMWYPDEILS